MRSAPPSVGPVYATIVVNGFLGYIGDVFMGAAAGNANADIHFSHMVALWVASFVVLAATSLALARGGRVTIGALLPFLTLPMLFGELVLAYG